MHRLLFPNRVSIHSAPVETLDRRKPDGQINHHKNLIENRPEPGKPDTFYTVNKHDRNHPDSSGNIKHAGGIGNAKHPVRHGFSAEQIIVFTSFRLFFQYESDDRYQYQIGNDNQEIDELNFHYV